MTENSSKYIISIYKFNDNKWKFIEDGYAFISEKSYGPVLNIRNKESYNDNDNVVYLDKIITSDLDIKYKVSDNNSGFTIRFEGDNKIGIKFDKSSSQSFEQFKADLTKHINTSYVVLNYDSGNIQYSGQFVDGKVDGIGTEFYDTPEQKIKYQGEFEDNLYDGSGVFFSYDGSLEIKINNISRGLPNGKVKLTIHRNKRKKIIKNFNYRSLQMEEEITANGNDFCEKIARYLFPELDNLLFEAYTIEEKIDEINRKMDILLDDRTREIIELERANRGYLQKLVGYFW